MRTCETKPYVNAGPKEANLDNYQRSYGNEEQNFQVDWRLIAQLPPSDDYCLLGQYLWQHGITHRLVKKPQQTLLLVTDQCNPEQLALLTKQVLSQGVLKQSSIFSRPEIYHHDKPFLGVATIAKRAQAQEAKINSYHVCALLILLSCLVFILFVF